MAGHAGRTYSASLRYYADRVGLIGGDWVRQAACKDLDLSLFFPSGGQSNEVQNTSFTRGKRVCAACPVQLECLAAAVEMEGSSHITYGLFGGATPKERQSTRRRKTALELKRQRQEGQYGNHL